MAGDVYMHVCGANRLNLYLLTWKKKVSFPAATDSLEEDDGGDDDYETDGLKDRIETYTHCLDGYTVFTDLNVRRSRLTCASYYPKHYSVRKKH